MFAELGRRGYKLARQIVVAVIGGTIVLAGVIMLVTPGPALIVIPVGLAVLALEFTWARRWLKKLKESLSPDQLNGYLKKARGLEASPGSAPGEGHSGQRPPSA